MRTTLLLDIAADAMGERPAIGDLSLSCLRKRARTAAAWLGEHEIEQVAFLGMNGPVFPTLLFAAGYAGLPFCPMNFRLPDEQLNALVARTAPSLLVADDDMVSRIKKHEGVTLVSANDFDRILAEGRPPPGEPADANSVAILLFTSGTTGEPKAAVLRHENLTSYVMGTVDLLGAAEDEAALVSVPAYHIAGISAVMSGVYAGRRIVYLPAFDADEWVATAEREQVTHAMVVPTMLDRILDAMEAGNRSLPTLKALSYGGGKMPEPVIRRAMQALPACDFVNAYGLTETSSTVALLSAEDHRAALSSPDPQVQRRIASVGRTLPGLELEIRAPDGNPLPVGESGEIYVRGPQVSGEYRGRQHLSDDGWFATRDAGWLDEAGYLFIEGRLDDVIVRGGENISPGEIEDCLRGHPAVADCAVFGLPSREWGEAVAAAVVCREEVEKDELANYVRAHLRSTKTPQHWSFEDSLPYSATGKLLRRELRDRLATSTQDASR